MTWFKKLGGVSMITDPFGPLEWRVLEGLWDRPEAASVRDVHPQFPEIAYTTVMTTMDRLHRKGVLDRVKRGRAFFYTPRFTRAQFESARATDALKAAFAGEATSLEPLLSFFVEAVGDHDRKLLDELEALVRARRADLEHKRS